LAAGDAYHWIHTRSRCSASYTRGGKGGGGGGGVSVIFSTIYIRIRILIYAYIYTHTYFCIFMSVLEALQFYIALHIHS